MTANLVARHGSQLMAMIVIADLVGEAAQAKHPELYTTYMSEMGRCIQARMRELGISNREYQAAGYEFYHARALIAVLDEPPA